MDTLSAETPKFIRGNSHYGQRFRRLPALKQISIPNLTADFLKRH